MHRYAERAQTRSCCWQRGGGKRKEKARQEKEERIQLEGGSRRRSR